MKCLEGTDIIPKEQSKICPETISDISFKKLLGSVKDDYNTIRKIVVECENFLNNKNYEDVFEKEDVLEKIEQYRKLILG